MLQLTPAETIMFQKNNNNEYFGNVEILNIGKKAITYKVSEYEYRRILMWSLYTR